MLVGHFENKMGIKDLDKRFYPYKSILVHAIQHI